MYVNFGAKSKYLGHALVITPHSSPWDVITYAYPR